MTTAATITAKLVLDNKQFQQGMAKAGQAADKVSGKMAALDGFLKKNAVAMAAFGESMSKVGKKMTMLVTLPIIGFFGMIIKKAMEANTELSKMAKEAVGKMNDSLARLGEKFLPLFIKVVDGITNLVNKFLDAPPATQKFITTLVLLAAMAGPLLNFAGTMIGVVSTLGTMGITAATVGTALAGLGSAFVALLPVLALIIAVVVLVMLIWNNWAQLSTTIQQIWWLVTTSFQQGAILIANYIDGIGIAFANFIDSIFMAGSSIVTLYEDGSGALLDLAVAFGFPEKATQEFLASVWLLYDSFKSKINGMGTTVQRIGAIINGVWNSIVGAIQTVINAVKKLIAELAKVVLPADLTPGSPTPFEVGLRGISSAMDTLSKKSLPQLTAGLSVEHSVSSAGGGNGVSVYNDNRNFAGGMSAKELQVALNSKFAAISKRM